MVDRKLVSAMDAKDQSSFQNVIQYLPQSVSYTIHSSKLIGRQAILLLGSQLTSMAVVVDCFVYQVITDLES
jgi:hypothetical protein